MTPAYTGKESQWMHNFATPMTVLWRSLNLRLKSGAICIYD